MPNQQYQSIEGSKIITNIAQNVQAKNFCKN